DQQLRIADQRLSDAEALTHPAGEAAECPPAVLVEGAALAHPRPPLVSFVAVGNALEQREVAQHVLGGGAGIDAELLRQVAEPAPYLVRLLQDVQVTQRHAAAVWL